jgi:hypothetical protein
MVLTSLFFAAAPAVAQEGTGSSKWRVLGTFIGIAAGGAAGVLYYRQTDCYQYGDWYENSWAVCVLPGVAMAAGGGVAGYFMGRAADKSRSTESGSQRSSRRVSDVIPIATIRLRRVPREGEPHDRLFRGLFGVDAGGSRLAPATTTPVQFLAAGRHPRDSERGQSPIEGGGLRSR